MNAERKTIQKRPDIRSPRAAAVGFRLVRHQKCWRRPGPCQPVATDGGYIRAFSVERVRAVRSHNDRSASSSRDQPRPGQARVCQCTALNCGDGRASLSSDDIYCANCRQPHLKGSDHDRRDAICGQTRREDRTEDAGSGHSCPSERAMELLHTPATRPPQQCRRAPGCSSRRMLPDLGQDFSRFVADDFCFWPSRRLSRSGWQRSHSW